MSMRLLQEISALSNGQSYWKARLSSGRMLCELDTIGLRKTEWLEDLVASGDLANVTEVTLCTPQGDARLKITEPHTAFQFSQGMLTLDGRTKTAQVVGVVTDKATGQCDYAVWDVPMQHLYTGWSNVHKFEAWRPGIIDIGALNLEALDLRGVL
jgi:hypothetical protein